jgi:uncharacterized protein YifE (UPF0438 family)
MSIKHLNTDLIYEESMGVPEAARAFRHGQTSIRRYITLGVRSPVTGERVYLEACYGPAKEMRTSIQAWRRFQERINGAV